MGRLGSLLERRSLIARLVAGFAALLLTVLFLGFNSFLAVRDLSRQAAELHQMELLGISRIKEANIDLVSTGQALRQMVLAPTFVDRDQARDQLGESMRHLEAQVAAARPSITSGPERLLLNDFEQGLAHYKRNVDEAIALIDRSLDYQVKSTNYVSGDQFSQVADSVDRSLRRMVAIKEERAREAVVAMAGYSRDAQWLTLALLLGSLLFGMIVIGLISRFMKRPEERSYHVIDNPVKEFAGDAMPLVGYRGDALVVDEQGAIISSDYTSAASDDRTRVGFEPREPASIRQASILVVEGDDSGREVTTGLQANAGCRVTVASNGQEVLALLAEKPYDVVLMNMQMPMTDGIDTTLEIRKKSAFDRLPIIAMTANSVHRDRERCLAAGMDGHIAKPIDPDALFRALMCWIMPDTLSRQSGDHQKPPR